MYDYIRPTVNRISGRVEPTDIKVFYEDGKPYIHYKGILDYMGDQYSIDIPKMDMVIKTLEHISEVDFYFGSENGNVLHMPVINEVHAKHEIYFTVNLIKKRMSKSEIEKELGYKVDITD